MPEVKVTKAQTGLETIQWFIFLLANAVALPIVLGSIFQLDFQQVAGLMQRTFFVVGMASLLQGLIGHRLPIIEGPAGLWISIFSVMAVTGAQKGKTALEILQTIEAAILCTGFFLVLFGIFRLASKVMTLFTPLVTGAFLFLLTVQLSGTFLKGMFGIQDEVEAIHGLEAMLALLTFLIVLGLATFARGWLASYAVLIGISAGWLAYGLLLGSEESSGTESAVFAAPEWLAWGMPHFTFSILPVSFLLAVLLLSNVVASVAAVSQSVSGQAIYTGRQINRGSIQLGINHGIAGGFSTIANVPLATSAGFIHLTGQKRKAPFLCASLLLAGAAFFPPLVTLISRIPSPIANAALFATFVQLMGLGLRNLTSAELDSRRLTIIGVSFLFGIGLMFMPLEVFAELPALFQNLASNGLLVGTVLVIVLEQVWKETDEIRQR